MKHQYPANKQNSRENKPFNSRLMAVLPSRSTGNKAFKISFAQGVKNARKSAPPRTATPNTQNFYSMSLHQLHDACQGILQVIAA